MLPRPYVLLVVGSSFLIPVAALASLIAARGLTAHTTACLATVILVAVALAVFTEKTLRPAPQKVQAKILNRRRPSDI